MNTPTAGQIIRAYREQEGLTQDELAEIIHVTKGKLSHWESGETIPRPSMVARLIGALRLSEDQAAALKQAVEEAALLKEKEQAAMQAVINEQTAEAERIEHRRKALKLLWMGLGGFVIGCLFVLLTGAYQDGPLYFTPVIGILVAGIPFGWSVLTDKSEADYQEPSYDPYNRDSYLLIDLVIFLLRFVGAYLIGITAFPVILLYHAFQAGKKGSLYRKIMCAMLVLAVLFIGGIVFILLFNALPRT